MDIQTINNYQFAQKGEGKPLILLHGLMGALSNFEAVLSHFSKNHNVLIPLLPIYTLPIINTSVKSIARYLHKFIAELELKDFTLVGNSLGGHVALYYNKNFSPKSTAMVLSGSSGLYETSMGDSFPQRSNYEFVKKKTEEVFYNPKNVATKALVDTVFEAVNNREKAIRIVMMAKSAIRHNMSKDLKELKMPTCIIWGKQDNVTPPNVAEKFHELLPNSELHWIDKCGHAPMMEMPKKFNAILEKWLTKIHNENK